MREVDFQRQVTDLLDIYRFEWVHFRPARTAHGWATPVSGPLGAGWPDLMALGHGRRLAIELKSDTGRTAAQQEAVLDVLERNGFEVYVWWPKDIETIAGILRSAPDGVDGSSPVRRGSEDAGAIGSRFSVGTPS